MSIKATTPCAPRTDNKEADPLAKGNTSGSYSRKRSTLGARPRQGTKSSSSSGRVRIVEETGTVQRTGCGSPIREKHCGEKKIFVLAMPYSFSSVVCVWILFSVLGSVGLCGDVSRVSDVSGGEKWSAAVSLEGNPEGTGAREHIVAEHTTKLTWRHSPFSPTRNYLDKPHRGLKLDSLNATKVTEASSRREKCSPAFCIIRAGRRCCGMHCKSTLARFRATRFLGGRPSRHSVAIHSRLLRGQ